MSEHEHDGFYWEPDPGSPLRQGDLLLNVPVTVLSDSPEFVLRSPHDEATAELQSYDEFPDLAPSQEFVTLGDWGALSMVMTPTCHVSEDEKNEDVVAVVPVQPARLVVDDATLANLRSGTSNVLHLFHLPPTELGDRLLPFHAVALLDRPACFPKHRLRDYRRLGLFRDQRYELRKKLARFWARGDSDQALERDLKAKVEHDAPLEAIE